MCTCPLYAVCPNVTCCIWQLGSLLFPLFLSSVSPHNTEPIPLSSLFLHQKYGPVRSGAGVSPDQRQCRSKNTGTPCGRAAKAVPALLGQTVCLSHVQRFRWLDVHPERQRSCSWWRKKNYGQGERENNVKVYHVNGALRPRPVHVQASRFEFTLNVNTFAQAFLRMDLLQVEEIPQE